LAARVLACAASRVRFLAALRVRRPVCFVGDLAAVERVVLRVAFRVVLLRAVLFRVVPLRLVVVLPVVVAM